MLTKNEDTTSSIPSKNVVIISSIVFPSFPVFKTVGSHVVNFTL